MVASPGIADAPRSRTAETPNTRLVGPNENDETFEMFGAPLYSDDDTAEKGYPMSESVHDL